MDDGANVQMRQTRTVRRARKEAEHRWYDIAGIALIAAGVIVLLSLLLRDTGVLGDAAGQALRMLFGKGAWAIPLMLALMGVAVLLGRRRAKLGIFAWGLVIVCLAILGFLAKTDGDYFDPDHIAVGGGYIGSIVGWAFQKLLGVAMPVGLGALATAGVIMVVNVPAQAVFESLADRARRLKERRPTMVAPKPRPAQEKPRPVIVDPPERPAPVRERPDPRVTVSPIPNVTQPQPKEGYTLPPLSLLREPESRPKRSQAEMQENIDTIESTLEEFGIEANVVEIANGPTITRYEIQLGPGVRVGKITSLADNIAMSLAANHVRVEAPIPGKSAIGIEVPNAKRSMVTLRSVAQDDQFLKADSRVIVCLGQDVSGHNQYADLAKMPHLLVGGATNSGKSIGLASIITSLLLRNTPKEVKLVLLDPKRVELTLFDGVPHLMCPVVKDVKQMAGVLRQVWREMDRRYDVFSDVKARNIEAYNAQATFADRLPYIVVVIDELADLMIQAAAEVETSICRLAQLARATGIHLVIATQRPSVDVITGTIKANISSRIAFSVSSQVDSRTILDCAGAEQLIGQGDMLFLPIDANKPLRIQGCYVTEAEIAAICDFWRSQSPPQYQIDPVAALVEREEARMDSEESDPFWSDAVRWVVDRGQASTSMLQRRFSIGFQRASRLLDLMEERGIVGQRDGPRPREVLVSPEDVEGYV
ncbi:MAG TPA: DNA translocase FtsK 4TM domain-containing protein [Fimbriimonadales bacterium]|jgi:S-DNA-T family DNA segregation ATPase FtsK/SpoIIIE|nr:DNA translocase FtsK 4TM domain-containing protein [Fimbriimonadales bacterium]